MAVASSRYRTRLNTYNLFNPHNQVKMVNSYDLSDDARYQRSIDRIDYAFQLYGPNTDINIATWNVEHLQDNQQHAAIWSQHVNMENRGVGGHRHVKGFHDGTDIAGNVGHAEGTIQHTDDANFPVPHGNTNNSASHIHSMGMSGALGVPASSTGTFQPTDQMRNVVIAHFARQRDELSGIDGRDRPPHFLQGSNAVHENRIAMPTGGHRETGRVFDEHAKGKPSADFSSYDPARMSMRNTTHKEGMFQESKHTPIEAGMVKKEKEQNVSTKKNDPVGHIQPHVTEERAPETMKPQTPVNSNKMFNSM